jgi:hypothetical protein
LEGGSVEVVVVVVVVEEEAYCGILLSKSGYCLVIVVLLSLYSGVSNSPGSGSFSFSNFDFISSLIN